MSRRAVVLKMGGSVLTDKDGYCAPNREALDAYLASFARAWPLVRSRVVLVLGGGSFGNAIPTRYGIDDPRKPHRPADLFRMTSGMFGWACAVVERLGDFGVPAYPFQASALFVRERGELRATGLAALAAAMHQGLVPVVTGDLVLGDEPRFSIVSSDLVPELLLDAVPVARVAMMSNVEGLLADPGDPASIVARVDRSNRAAALASAGPSTAQDITGGMRTKVKALLRLADRGVEAVLFGADPARIEPVLVSPEPPGTLFVADDGSNTGVAAC